MHVAELVHPSLPLLTFNLFEQLVATATAATATKRATTRHGDQWTGWSRIALCGEVNRPRPRVIWGWRQEDNRQHGIIGIVMHRRWAIHTAPWHISSTLLTSCTRLRGVVDHVGTTVNNTPRCDRVDRDDWRIMGLARRLLDQVALDI
jgi:hypothetical protein